MMNVVIASCLAVIASGVAYNKSYTTTALASTESGDVYCNNVDYVWIDNCDICYCDCPSSGADCTTQCADLDDASVADVVKDYCQLDCDSSSWTYDSSYCDCPYCPSTTNELNSTSVHDYTDEPVSTYDHVKSTVEPVSTRLHGYTDEPVSTSAHVKITTSLHGYTDEPVSTRKHVQSTYTHNYETTLQSTSVNHVKSTHSHDYYSTSTGTTSSGGGPATSDEEYCDSSSAGSVRFDKDSCQLCICVCESDTSNVGSSTGYTCDEKCYDSATEDIYEYVAEECDLTCEYNDAVWVDPTSDGDCVCPFCHTSTSIPTSTEVGTTHTHDDHDYTSTGRATEKNEETKHVTQTATTTSVSSDDTNNNNGDVTTTMLTTSINHVTYTSVKTTQDDDDVFDDDANEDPDSSYDDLYYLVAGFELSVTNFWDDRSEIWYVLKYAMRELLGGSSDYDSTNAGLFMTDWKARKHNSNRRMGRRLLENVSSTSTSVPSTTRVRVTSNNNNNAMTSSTGVISTETNTLAYGVVETTPDNDDGATFTFEITIYDGDEDIIEKLYDYIISLATSFATDYGTNCQSSAANYGGFGTTTVESASIAYYDSDGTEIQSETYENDPAVISNDASKMGYNVYMITSVVVPLLYALCAVF